MIGRRIKAFKYGCAMVCLPDLISQQITGYAQSIPRVYLSPTEDAPLGISSEIHVTILYGLLTSRPEEVAKVLAPLLPVSIILGRTGVFHNEEHIVLKLSVQSPDLARMHREVCRKIDHSKTHPEYKPHVTMAYLVKNDRNPYYYRTFYTDQFAGMKVDIDWILFTTESGRRYEISSSGEVSSLGSRKP